MRQLNYIGTDSWERPVYKDGTGKLWKDVNLGDREPSLCSSADNDFDGEPDMPIEETYEIIGKMPANENCFQYMMLSRFQSDCEYYLGYGRRNPARLCGNTVNCHIAYMKQIWNSLPEDGKPDRLTWEQLLDYEHEMLHGTKQRLKINGKYEYFDSL